MAEPMSNGEIEDVLSSIRRLVSEDMRPPARGAAEAGKLILTPALRVVTEEVDVPPVIAPITQVVARLGAAVAERDEEWEPETGDAAPMAIDALQDGSWTDFIPDVDAAPDYDDDVVAFHSVRDAAGAKPEIAAWAQHEDEGVPDEPAPLAGTIEPDQAWADATEAGVIAELEEVVVERLTAAGSDDRFTDSAKGGDFAGSFDDGSFDDGAFDDQELTFNEDVLRELVRDLIREELQGTLGERITRNIRKLVRVEIARAMAVQDYK